MTSFAVISFINNHFVTTNSFSSCPEGPDGIGHIHYKEYRSDALTGEETLVNDFYIDTEEYYGPVGYDDADPLLKPYFKPGSFWDLRSGKWRSALWQEFIY